MVFIHYIRILSSVTMPTCDVLLRHFRKCWYTCRDTRLHTLISYLLLIISMHDKNGFIMHVWQVAASPHIVYHILLV